MNIEGITEDDIANYLVQTPGFFERHAALLATIALASPHGGRAVSLQERQMEMMRERAKGLERRIMEMIRHSQDNVQLSDKLHRWAVGLLRHRDAATLPDWVVQTLHDTFLIPAVALRVWGVDARWADRPWAAAVSDDLRTFAGSLSSPYCGVQSGFEAVQWLEHPAAVASVAMIPLHGDGPADCLGLLVLGSPDPTRFSADMGVDFLQRVGEWVSAGLQAVRTTAPSAPPGDAAR